ncbi:MAG: hypothetical protein ABSB76_10210 [Streptosporangiaceae bacterium]|jgi:hypothetical protein
MRALPEVRPPRPSARVRTAVGAGGRLSGWVLTRRYVLALVLVLLLGVAKILVAQRVVSVDTLVPPEHVVTSGLLIGGTPSDADLVELAADLKVDGVVNLVGPDVAEQVTAASLHQGYLYLPVAPNTAPTWPQLRELAAFMRGHAKGGALVYLHDDVGGGRAATAAEMLLLLDGRGIPAASADMTAAERGSMCDCQRLALQRLSAALHPAGHVPAGDPYAAARLDPW